jgi:hypothetical protein
MIGIAAVLASKLVVLVRFMILPFSGDTKGSIHCPLLRTGATPW